MNKASQELAQRSQILERAAWRELSRTHRDLVAHKECHEKKKKFRNTATTEGYQPKRKRDTFD
jgi:hypothetical protein